MTPQTTERILKYEEIKLKMKELEAEAVLLADAILSEIPDNTELELKQGKLGVASRSQWAYSPNTEQKAKELKQLQKEEQQRGTAVETKGKPYLIYRVNE